ncbi:MBL fold metallo-hydrolase [Paramixta manurensis]|uniref:MBL fold metallo-hydrolase n=1 Tax=Paramixta manurensis TaxID=2740817 RepID=A0A6M8UCA6_9GAMM|nr:MBL fold metallo-hydrolase [Erwiniaceae bacterium PD-1]
MRLLPLLALGLLAASGSSALFAAETLTVDVYNPGADSLFPVSSEIVSGPHEVALIDAQFQRNDAQELVKRIKTSGKKLTTVFISQSDPDFYFGLETIKAAFPQAKILATPQTVEQIKKTQQIKLSYWGPQLKENAPTAVVIPEPLKGNHFTVDGMRVEVKGLTGPNAAHSWLWVPSLKTVMGGVVVTGDNMHVWLADAQTKQARAAWLQTLDAIRALKPARVIPGHFLPGADESIRSVNFTRDYIRNVERALPGSANAAALINTIKTRYPDLKDESSLALSAKVLKGEMSWP